jgi:hypothetical protein
MTEEIINLQALLVKSYLLNALLINRKAFPIGYHGAQVLRPASRYSARLTAVRRDCLLWVCAVTRRRFPVSASLTRQPLQPEATGAAMEVTKWLKPSDSVSRIGDSASVQAAT